MLEAGFIASRFLHFAAVLILFGVALFPFYAWPATMRPEAARVLRGPLIGLGFLTLISGALWFVCAVDNMAGITDGLPDWDSVSYVLWQTDFGTLWLTRSAVAVLAWIACLITRRPHVIVMSLTAALLASLAGTGHTQIGADSGLHAANDALHLLAAGAWLGGLTSLMLVLLRGTADHAATALIRFSGMGYAAVAVLIVSGLANSWFLVGTVPNLFDTAYGRILIAKFLLFGLMLALAGLNRFIFVPRLSRAGGARETALSHMKRSVFWEQTLGFGVIIAVAVLGTTTPPAG